MDPDHAHAAPPVGPVDPTAPVAPGQEEPAAEAPPGRAGAAQARAGLLGLPIVALGFIILGILPGGPQTALETVGPIATFALPVLAASALWWEGWPATRLRQPQAGLVNLVLIIIGGIVLTVLAQAVVGQIDLVGMFTTPPQGSPTFTTWPWTMPLGVLVFVATLQFTFVNEGWPLRRSSRVVGGFLVVLTSWIVGLVVYFLIVNWDLLPTPAREGIGLGNPGGPVSGLELLGWLAIVTAFQVLFYIGLGGWPTSYIRNPAARIAAANVFVIGGGWLTWALLAKGLAWETPTIAALGGSVAAAAVLSAILFDNWPAFGLRDVNARLALTALQIAVVTAVLFFGLRALGNALQVWDRDPVELWVTVANLNFIAATAITHVAVFHRWPIPPARTA
ncbi:MAG: hypothetical protein JOY78_06125 [Pseudonocardia sp.]|nr:hypothetical protein [Pseudonocardia sp.]